MGFARVDKFLASCATEKASSLESIPGIAHAMTLESLNTNPYVSDAAEVVNFVAVKDASDLDEVGQSTSFKPDMAHQIFGEEETIYGYRNLKIDILYVQDSLQMAIDMTYGDKVEPDGPSDPQPDDVVKQLTDTMPFDPVKGARQGLRALLQRQKQQPFAPPGDGEPVHTFTVGGGDRRFEVYRVNADTRPEGFSGLFNRMQYFALWFIDGSSFVDSEDDRWVFFIVYERSRAEKGEGFAFVGYACVYEYYAYPANIRPRIAHMLVLPPFQRKGVGLHLLQAVYRNYRVDSRVVDITVEDPAESFVRLRDVADCLDAAQLPLFAPASLSAGFTAAMAAQARLKLKMGRRQARRVYEILRLKHTDVSDAAAYAAYRLDVKKRLGAPFFNQAAEQARLASLLSEGERKLALTKAQRVAQVGQMYENLLAEYRSTLDRLDAAKEHGFNAVGVQVVSPGVAEENGRLNGGIEGK